VHCQLGFFAAIVPPPATNPDRADVRDSCFRGGAGVRLSVTSAAAAAAVMAGYVFVCSGTAAPYSLLAE